MLYLILTITFAVIGTFNFRGMLDEFSSIWQSCLTVLDYSVIYYDFKTFDHLDNFHRVFGHMFIVVVVVVYKILVSNLILSALSNIFSTYENNSEGLYLSMILS